jgi:hypothetical protein
MAIRKYTITSGAIAADGTASAYSPVIRGKLLAVSINYPAATCTVDLDEQDTANNQKLLDLAAANTDLTVYPRKAVQDNTGANVTYDGTNEIYEHFIVFGRIKLSIASGTATQVVVVDLIVEE